MMTSEAWAAWSRERVGRVEDVLEGFLPSAVEEPCALHSAMRYAVLGGGKRIRALLAYAAGHVAANGEESTRDGNAISPVDRAAAAVELIHAYSLIHDDLPCMDDDVLRRGKPTCHVAFGEATALLAGDALQSLAFEVLSDAQPTSQDAQSPLAMLSLASGSRGMAGGQAIDLDSVGQVISLAALERMHALKTGALIHAAVRIGASFGRALDNRELDALDRYASAIGLAFQAVDDVLDVEGTSASLGKTAGKDAARRKPTYVSLLGVTAARQRIVELHAEAHSALACFGASGRRLMELSDWIVLRKH